MFTQTENYGLSAYFFCELKNRSTDWHIDLVLTLQSMR
jgi:hypothetical protein